MKITLSFSDPYQSNFIMSPYLLLLFLVHAHVFKRYLKQHFHLLNYFGQNKHCLPPNQYFSIFTVSKCILGYMRDVLKMSRIFFNFLYRKIPISFLLPQENKKKVFTYNKATLQMPFLAIENLQNINILNTVTVPHHNTIR